MHACVHGWVGGKRAGERASTPTHLQLSSDHPRLLLRCPSAAFLLCLLAALSQQCDQPLDRPCLH